MRNGLLGLGGSALEGRAPERSYGRAVDELARRCPGCCHRDFVLGRLGTHSVVDAFSRERHAYGDNALPAAVWMAGNYSLDFVVGFGGNRRGNCFLRLLATAISCGYTRRD